MNVNKVESRECLIIGNGKIPTAEVTQVVKEFTGLSDKIVWSWLALGDSPEVPHGVLNQIEHDALADDFISYDIKLSDHPDWTPYHWADSDLVNLPDGLDDLVILWLLTDEPDTEPEAAEVTFVQSALDAGRDVLVMTEGLWQIDRIEESSLFERVVPESLPKNDPVLPGVPADLRGTPTPPPVPTDLPVPTGPVSLNLLTGEMTPIDDPEIDPVEPDDIPDPADAHPDYDTWDKEMLKAEVVERHLKADKRSVEAMITALVADDADEGTVLQFARPAEPDHPSNGASDTPPFGTTDEDDAPMVPEDIQELSENVDELTEATLPADADEAQERWAALEEKQAARRASFGAVDTDARDKQARTSEAVHGFAEAKSQAEIDKATMLAKVAENLEKVEAGAEKIKRMAEEVKAVNTGFPALTDDQALAIGERIVVGVDHSATLIAKLETAAGMIQNIALLNTQLASVLLEAVKEVKGE